MKTLHYFIRVLYISFFLFQVYCIAGFLAAMTSSKAVDGLFVWSHVYSWPEAFSIAIVVLIADALINSSIGDRLAGFRLHKRGRKHVQAQKAN